MSFFTPRLGINNLSVKKNDISNLVEIEEFSCKKNDMLYLTDLMDFSYENVQNSLKTKSCLSVASLILFRILGVFIALKNPYSLDFLFLFYQEKRKSIDNQRLRGVEIEINFYRKTLVEIVFEDSTKEIC